VTGFALLFQLLKLRTLLLRQNCKYFLMRSSHGSTNFGAQGFHASYRVGAWLTLAALAQSAHLFALGLDARGGALVDGAKLLLLSVAQIELSHQAHRTPWTAFATAMAFATSLEWALLRVVVLLLLLRATLRECGNAERQAEAEC
jgi:hypothetical protein